MCNVERDLRVHEPAQTLEHVQPPCARLAAEFAALADQTIDGADILQSKWLRHRHAHSMAVGVFTVIDDARAFNETVDVQKKRF